METSLNVKKRILWLAALACALPAGIAVADGSTRAPLQVWAIGLPNGYVVMEHQARVLEVTAEDVAKGMVEVRGGSRIAITTDSPGGYTVDFHGRSPLIQTAWIGGIGHAVEIDSRGGTVVEREVASGRRVVAIDYRFVLSPDAVAGRYAWPLDMAVRAPMPADYARPNGAHRLASFGVR